MCYIIYTCNVTTLAITYIKDTNNANLLVSHLVSSKLRITFLVYKANQTFKQKVESNIVNTKNQKEEGNYIYGPSLHQQLFFFVPTPPLEILPWGLLSLQYS